MGSITEIQGKKGKSFKATAIADKERRIKTFSEAKYGNKAKSMAKTWITNTEQSLTKGDFVSTAEQRKTPLSEVIDIYEAKVLPSHAKTSQSREKPVMKRMKEYFGKDRPFLSITGEVLVKWVEDCKEKGIQDGTIIKYLRQFQWLTRAAKIELNLTFNDDPHTICYQILRHRGMMLNGAKRTRRIEETEKGDSELDLLLKYKHPGETTISLVITFAVETGMRRGEIAALNWSDIDFKKKVAIIRKSKTDKATGKVGRIVPLSPKAIEALKDTHQMAVEKLIEDGISEIEAQRKMRENKDASIFGMSPDSISRAFLRTCRRVGIEGLHFHDLRHEFVTSALERGFTPAEVGTITGQSLAIVMRYTHFRPEDLATKMHNLSEA